MAAFLPTEKTTETTLVWLVSAFEAAPQVVAVMPVADLQATTLFGEHVMPLALRFAALTKCGRAGAAQLATLVSTAFATA